ncbi:MAG: hypothetical protein HY084_10655 [Gemmatimonadetes bacterium]|nr:hypothetical protein [Gemmatimonadota bacterium]
MKLLLPLLLLSSLPLSAQQKPAQPPQSKEDAAKALRTLQDQIETMRKQRLELEAQAERTLSLEVGERAKRLAMGGEAGALQKLEFLLDSAQNRLIVQRDRIRLLKDVAATNQQTAVVVVLLRADVLPAGALTAALTVDGNPLSTVRLTPVRAKAVAAGAADELYRAEIAPTGHTLKLDFTGQGLTAGESITIPAAPNQVTYVEFVITARKMTATTWTNRATPF